jgi:pimeloyl-ACP methyl ester carboxylesterase/GNAT superfamily N-acetyltransferase
MGEQEITPDFIDFKERAMASCRNVQERGYGSWWGTFMNDQLVGDMGLFFDPDEKVGRFQSVETHTDYQNRGVCKTILKHILKWSIEDHGISDLVIVTTKENHAQHVYRSMGFDLHSFQYGVCLSKPYLSSHSISHFMKINRTHWLFLLMVLTNPIATMALENIEHKFADNDGVKIHYVTTGDGPLIVFVHGFPDFWYSWRHQMEGLKDDYRVVALDTRGYNKSDKPEKQEDYDMSLLVGDVAAVIRAENQESAIIVGHDWGGLISWQFAMTHPEMISKLVIVNLPHPKGLSRELANNEEQQANFQYARNFQKPDSHEQLDARRLAGFVAKDYTLGTIPGVGHWSQEDLTIQYPIDPDPAKECQCVQRHDDRPHSK